MKIKINKEQASYINGLETREAKKDFILEHILLSLEASLDKESVPESEIPMSDRFIASALAIMATTRPKSNIERIDPLDDETLQKMRDAAEPYGYDCIHHSTKNYTIGEIVEKVTELSVEKIENKNLLKFDLPKESSREKFDKFIEDNGLKKFTPPEIKNLDDIDNLLDRLNEKGLDSNNIIIKDGKEYNLSEMSMTELNKFAILEILNDNPSLIVCVEMKNFCAKIGEYELCAKFREKEKQLLEKTPPQGESLSKEQLKDTTKPIDELIDSVADNFLNDFNAKLKKVVLEDGAECYYSEWKLLEDPNPVKDPIFYGYLSKEGVNHIATKKYTKEDLEKAFNKGRIIHPMQGIFRHFRYKDFEDYFKTL